MEAEEIQEFAEKQKESRETRLFEVSFSIAVLAVLVALVTVMSHRAHTSAVLNQARASDEWALYQARRMRQTASLQSADLLEILAPGNTAANAKLAEYRRHAAAYDKDLKESQAKAHSLEEQVEAAEHHATRFDAGEALLQIAVVLSSITLLTRQRIYWLIGLGIGGLGLAFSALGFLAH